MNNSYDKILIDGYPYLKGNPPFNKVSYLGLNIGDKIHKIGRLSKNGKETSANRIFTCKPYMTYSGMFIDKEENRIFLAFLLPSDGITGWNLFNPKRDIYCLFSFIDDVKGEEPELIRPNLKELTIQIYKANFIKL